MSGKGAAPDISKYENQQPSPEAVIERHFESPPLTPLEAWTGRAEALRRVLPEFEKDLRKLAKVVHYNLLSSEEAPIQSATSPFEKPKTIAATESALQTCKEQAKGFLGTYQGAWKKIDALWQSLNEEGAKGSLQKSRTIIVQATELIEYAEQQRGMWRVLNDQGEALEDHRRALALQESGHDTEYKLLSAGAKAGQGKDALRKRPKWFSSPREWLKNRRQPELRRNEIARLGTEEARLAELYNLTQKHHEDRQASVEEKHPHGSAVATVREIVGGVSDQLGSRIKELAQQRPTAEVAPRLESPQVVASLTESMMQILVLPYVAHARSREDKTLTPEVDSEIREILSAYIITGDKNVAHDRTKNLPYIFKVATELCMQQCDTSLAQLDKVTAVAPQLRTRVELESLQEVVSRTSLLKEGYRGNTSAVLNRAIEEEIKTVLDALGVIDTMSPLEWEIVSRDPEVRKKLSAGTLSSVRVAITDRYYKRAITLLGPDGEKAALQLAGLPSAESLPLVLLTMRTLGGNRSFNGSVDVFIEYAQKLVKTNTLEAVASRFPAVAEVLRVIAENPDTFSAHRIPNQDRIRFIGLLRDDPEVREALDSLFPRPAAYIISGVDGTAGTGMDGGDYYQVPERWVTEILSEYATELKEGVKIGPDNPLFEVIHARLLKMFEARRVIGTFSEIPDDRSQKEVILDRHKPFEFDDPEHNSINCKLPKALYGRLLEKYGFTRERLAPDSVENPAYEALEDRLADLAVQMLQSSQTSDNEKRFVIKEFSPNLSLDKVMPVALDVLCATEDRELASEILNRVDLGKDRNGFGAIVTLAGLLQRPHKDMLEGLIRAKVIEGLWGYGDRDYSVIPDESLTIIFEISPEEAQRFKTLLQRKIIRPNQNSVRNCLTLVKDLALYSFVIALADLNGRPIDAMEELTSDKYRFLELLQKNRDAVIQTIESGGGAQVQNKVLAIFALNDFMRQRPEQVPAILNFITELSPDLPAYAVSRLLNVLGGEMNDLAERRSLLRKNPDQLSNVLAIIKELPSNTPFDLLARVLDVSGDFLGQNPNRLKEFIALVAALPKGTTERFIIDVFSGLGDFLVKNQDTLPRVFALIAELPPNTPAPFVVTSIERLLGLSSEEREIYFSIFKKIDESPSQEIQRLKDAILSQIVNAESLDAGQRTFQIIESIFIQNNLPLVGKVYKIFTALYPEKALAARINEKSSPVLQAARPGRRYTIIYQDLLRVHFESGNRSLRDYLGTLQEGESLFADIDANGIDSLKGDNKKRAARFLRHVNQLFLTSSLGEGAQSITGRNELSLEEQYQALLDSLGVKDGQTVTGRIAEMFLKPMGFKSIAQALDFMKEAKQKADARGREVERSANGRLTLREGDLLKGVDHQFINQILQNGSVAVEFLGAHSGADSTAFDTDLGRVMPEHAQMGFEGAVKKSLSSSYGSLILGLRNDERFVTTTVETGKANIKSPQMELFKTLREDHYGIRTGFGTTNIDFMIAKADIVNSKKVFENLCYEIAKDGFYIPIADETGKIIFTSEQYDEYRKVFEGVAQFEGGAPTYSETREGDSTFEAVAATRKELTKDFEHNDRVQRQIMDTITDALRANKITVKDSLDSSILGAELSDTGSTGRHTNLPGSYDFDFALRLDTKDAAKVVELAQAVKGRFTFTKEDSHPDDGGYYQLRLFGVTAIDGKSLDAPTDIDVGFSLKSDLSVFGSHDALRTKYASVREKFGQEAYEDMLANILFAKKVLKEGKAYKKYEDGGFGGIGTENWIMAHGGSALEAFRSLYRAAHDDDGNVLDFAEFKKNYRILDAGFNIKFDRYDDYVEVLKESGYKKMLSAIEPYVKKKQVEGSQEAAA